MDGKFLVAAAVSVLLVVLSKLRSLLSPKPKLNLPPGPWTLPVIGSLHHLVSSPVIYRGMRDLAQKHGPLMMLRLGEVPTLVVSSPEAAQAITKTHDVAFADRHVSATMAALTFGATDLVFGSYGERWRQLRKITVLELLSAGRVQSSRRIREEEVARFVRSLAAAAGAGAGPGVNITKMISQLINDTFVRECVGARCKYQDEYLETFDEAVRLTFSLTLADLFPSSSLMQMLGSAPRKALACRKRIEHILKQVIQEKKEALERGDETANDGLLSALLRLQKERSTPIELTDDTVVALMFDMFAAGSDTSSLVLNWTMTELMRHPAVMAKSQAEVRDAFKGKATTALTEDDLARTELPYLACVIKESLRLHSPGPVLVPRRCREACRVMGYDIPKGTSVLINVWAISRDPKHWDDPEEFKPERFERSSLDYKGTCYEFLPFGSGRRMCPGANLGLANLELALASLLYHFDWKLPDGVQRGDTQVWEAPGLVGKKKTDLVLHPITRIAPAPLVTS